MRTVIVLLFSILVIMETHSQNVASNRQPVGAGRFYPADLNSLQKMMKQLFESCKKSEPNSIIRAIISPHAGYVYSGGIAAAAYSAIPPSSRYKNIFIIGSSHVMSFEGASVYDSGDFITPLGTVKVNRQIAINLKSSNKVFSFSADAHIREHSIEVQLPFIQYYFKEDPPIVPIIIGTADENTIKKIANILSPWFTDENLFIISSDFSHYPDYSNATKTDKITAESIVSGDPQIFLNTLQRTRSEKIEGLATSMCGWSSGLALLYLTQGNEFLEYKLIDYCNSGDSSYGNKDEVVGYHAIVVTEETGNDNSTNSKNANISFSDEEISKLFSIAKGSITSKFSEQKQEHIDITKMSANLRTPMGAFVTIKIDGMLRGCIGRFISSAPLCEAVRSSAISSAFEDPRFPPITKEEFDKTDMEITVLGPLKKINDPDEIILGKHGIYIKKGLRSGTMLPQVATENGWSVEEFLGYTSRDKAGIGWDGWKEAELYIYEGIVLVDKKE